MTFRDVHAALERIAVLERENARLRDELDALKIENAMLRADRDADKDAIIAQLVAERDALAADLSGESPQAKEEEATAMLEDKVRSFLGRLRRRY